jgi:hypothetical protein
MECGGLAAALTVYKATPTQSDMRDSSGHTRSPPKKHSEITKQLWTAAVLPPLSRCKQ